MRGADITQESSFTTAALANFVPQHHTLREIRALVDEALGKMNSVFSTLYPQAAAGKVRPERARGPEKGDCQTKITRSQDPLASRKSRNGLDHGSNFNSLLGAVRRFVQSAGTRPALRVIRRK